MPAVFDGFLWAAADTGHAVGAVVFPNRPAVSHLNIAEGTDRSAFAAGDARAGDAELFGVDEHRHLRDAGRRDDPREWRQKRRR